MKKQVSRLFAAPAMAALCVAPTLGQEEPLIMVGMHDRFVHVCSDDGTTQAVFPMALEYAFEEPLKLAARRIPDTMAAYFEGKLGNLLNYSNVMEMVEYGSADTILRGYEFDQYKRSAEELMGGWISAMDGGAVVFAPGCEEKRIDDAWYSTHLDKQYQVRDVLIQRREQILKHEEERRREDAKRLTPTA